MGTGAGGTWSHFMLQKTIKKYFIDVCLTPGTGNKLQSIFFFAIPIRGRHSKKDMFDALS